LLQPFSASHGIRGKKPINAARARAALFADLTLLWPVVVRHAVLAFASFGHPISLSARQPDPRYTCML
jgi:hypothetical protein